MRGESNAKFVSFLLTINKSDAKTQVLNFVASEQSSRLPVDLRMIKSGYFFDNVAWFRSYTT